MIFNSFPFFSRIGLDDLKKGEMFLLTGMGIVTETCSYKFSNMKWLDQISTTDLYPTLVKCKGTCYCFSTVINTIGTSWRLGQDICFNSNQFTICSRNRSPPIMVYWIFSSNTFLLFCRLPYKEADCWSDKSLAKIFKIEIN